MWIWFYILQIYVEKNKTMVKMITILIIRCKFKAFMIFPLNDIDKVYACILILSEFYQN